MGNVKFENADFGDDWLDERMFKIGKMAGFDLKKEFINLVKDTSDILADPAMYYDDKTHDIEGMYTSISNTMRNMNPEIQKIFDHYKVFHEEMTKAMMLDLNINKMKEYMEEDLLSIKDKDYYISVVAYAFAKDKDLSRTVRRMFDKLVITGDKHKHHALIKKENSWASLAGDEYKTYQKAFCILKESESDEKIKKELEDCVIRNYGGMYSYLLISKDHDETDMDWITFPVVSAYLQTFTDRKQKSLIIKHLVLFSIMIRALGYYRKDLLIEEAIGAVYLNEHPCLSYVSKHGANKLYNEICESVNENITDVLGLEPVSPFNSFIIAIEECDYYHYGEYLNETVVWLKGAKKKKIIDLLHEYICHIDFINNYVYKEDYVTHSDTLLDSAEDIIEYWSDEMDFDEEDRMPDSIKDWTDFLMFVARKIHLESIRDDSEDIFEKNELKAKESKKDDKIKELRSEISELTKKVMGYEKEQRFDQALKDENYELKKEVEKYKKKLADKEKDEKELFSLRNLLHDIDNEREYEEIAEEANDTKEMEKFLENNVRGVIIGGYESCLNKIQNILPSWKVYSTRVTVSPKVITDSDVVVMFTDFISHSDFNKTIAWVRNSDCQLIYLHSVNIPYIISEIYSKCKEGCA